jgi:MerR family transcriptional regulator, heat shock protein HspR
MPGIFAASYGYKLMPIEYWTIEEIKEELKVGENFLAELESEEIIVSSIHPEKRIPIFEEGELEKVRLAATLVYELGVNLAGVEVILHMRNNMVEMRRQIDRILEYVARQVREHLEKPHE